jgi:hypothetical protein
VGAPAEPVVALTSSDWQDVYADNAGHVRRAEGGPRGGPWNLQVERPGEYELTLRRWPAEVNLPLSAAEQPGSKALPIAGARVAIAGREFSAQAAPGDRSIALRVQLPSGPARLQAWFVDAAGQDLSGAFFADVKWLR